jgi:hypothetical protein
MTMNDMQFLTWVRGTGLDIAVSIFVLGVLWRLFEIYSLGRKMDLSAPREPPARPAGIRCSGAPCRRPAW